MKTLWKMLKAQLRYYRSAIILACLGSLIAFTVIGIGVEYPRNQPPMVMLILIIGTMMPVSLEDKIQQRNGGGRMLSQLPVSSRSIGLMYAAMGPAVFVCIFLSFLAARILVFTRMGIQNWGPDVTQLVTVFGLLLSIHSIVLLYRDLNVVPNPAKRVLTFFPMLIIYIGCLLPFYMMTNFGGFVGEGTPAQLFWWTWINRPAPFILAGLMLSALSVFVFARRPTYVRT